MSIETIDRKFDVIDVLGYGFDNNWKLPAHADSRLRTAYELYRAGVAPRIVVSGKWSLAWERNGITPPTTESALMQAQLITLGVPEEDIIMEADSMDTVSNAFYLKTRIMEPKNYKTALVLCADYVFKRVAYTFEKVFGDPETFMILATETPYANDPKMAKAQAHHLKMQQELFWNTLPPGNNLNLNNVLFRHPYYQAAAQDNVAEEIHRAALGKLL